MNVLFICEGLNDLTVVAQPWRHVFEISQRMQCLGTAVQILSDSQNGLDRESEINGVPIRRIRGNGFLFGVKELQRAINQGDIDIINWHGSDTWSSFHMWRLGNRIRKNIVWTLHSGPLSLEDFRNVGLREVVCLHKYWNNLLNAALPARLVTKWANIPQIRRIIVPSERVSNYLQSLKIAKEKIAVIPSGVDTHLFRPLKKRRIGQVKENLGFDEREQLLLYFGPLSTFRGIDTLIAAMPIINDKLPNARLLILGRNQKTNSASDLRSAKSSSRITSVMGVLEQETLIQYLSIADVVVLPFKFWPQVEIPLTVLESMAMEKPLITTWVGAVPEIVCGGKKALLIPPGKPGEIAEKAVKLLEDESLRIKVGKAARKHVEMFFDWKTVVRQTLTIFNQVADK